MVLSVRGTVTAHEKINVISQSEVLTQYLKNTISKQAYEVVGTIPMSDDRYSEFHLCDVGKEWWC